VNGTAFRFAGGKLNEKAGKNCRNNECHNRSFTLGTLRLGVAKENTPSESFIWYHPGCLPPKQLRLIIDSISDSADTTLVHDYSPVQGWDELTDEQRGAAQVQLDQRLTQQAANDKVKANNAANALEKKRKRNSDAASSQDLPQPPVAAPATLAAKEAADTPGTSSLPGECNKIELGIAIVFSMRLASATALCLIMPGVGWA
jgi:hypothetical protein